MSQGREALRPSVLVTGFSVFPGAPVNPTEALVAALEARRAGIERLCVLRTEVLAVDYQALPGRLTAISAEGCPDIAVHFGLSRAVTGFALERVARNAVAVGRADSAGFEPQLDRIRDGGEALATSLPVEDIHRALAARGLPVDYSDDAGDYLCNFLFYHSRGGLCAGFAPKMAGFVHVPPLAEEGGPMRLDALVEGAGIIVEVCCRVWRETLVTSGEAA